MNCDHISAVTDTAQGQRSVAATEEDAVCHWIPTRILFVSAASVLLNVIAAAPAAAQPPAFWGEFDLNELADEPNDPSQSRGAILQGFNFNDLAGSSLVGVPDLDGDGDSELVIGARFGKPDVGVFQERGWGAAYLIYGDASSRLWGVNALHSVGTGIPGLAFRGIRVPLCESNYTEGLSDITVVDDMDGDELPELAFSFPRVESLSLGAPAWVGSNAFQHPELLPDEVGMGLLEYDAIDYMGGWWITGRAQFTRGGIVIVSSHNELLSDPNQVTRRFDRVLDLHEVGQMFDFMVRPSLGKYIRQVFPNDPAVGCADCIPDVTGDCGGDPENEAETEYHSWIVKWDTWLGGGSESNWQGPGGFHMPWTGGVQGIYPADPPLANPSLFFESLPEPDYYHPCDDIDGDGNADGCEISHFWYGWVEEAMCMIGIPGTTAPPCLGAWVVDQTPYSAWTGFFGGKGVGTPRSYWRDPVLIPPTSVGARVLGQAVSDRFGTAVGSDGAWLYMSAPRHTALQEDVPALPEDRTHSGVVYQLRTNVSIPGQPNTAQLWVEPGMAYPNIDAEIPTRLDYTMPVPHQYVIETIGSIRGNYGMSGFGPFTGGCLEDHLRELTAAIDKAWAHPDDVSFEVSDAWEVLGYLPYLTATAGYNVDRTPQIVGPHADAHISFVRGLGDVDGDAIPDFAVGSDLIQEPDPHDPDFGNAVGAIYVVYGRPLGLEGDYLLENLHLDPSAPNRLKGIMLKGSSSGETLARVFADAGDFNDDGYADVIVGSDSAASDTGEVVVVLGSQHLVSPEYGWTLDGIVSAGHAIRFHGVAVGDLTGANVAGAGDVDSDGFDDILIAAPGADGGKGAVYLVYGSDGLSGEIGLADIGTIDLPGAKFIGRAVGDQLGGGEKIVEDTAPGGTQRRQPSLSA